MYKIKITTISDNVVTIYFTNRLAISQGKEKTTVLDGLHNNGGWSTFESAESIEARIDALIAEANR